jgi:hypothetical protein
MNETNMEFGLYIGYPNHELPFELHFLFWIILISFQNGVM